MTKLKKTGIIVMMAGALLLPAAGETLSLDEMIIMARVSNPALMEARNSLLSAESNLTGDLRLEESSLKASGSWTTEEGGTTQGSNPSGSLSLNVPVTDQISLSGSLSSGQDVSAAISLSPFSMTATKVSSETGYDNARTSLLVTEAAMDWDILDLGLALTLAEKEYEVTLQQEELANDQYKASYALYLAGDITYDDLLSAMDDLTSAEDSSLTAEKDLLTARQDLCAAIGSDSSIELEDMSMEEAAAFRDSLAEQVDSLSSEGAFSQSVTQARNALILAQREEKITLSFQPDLSVSAGISGNLDEPATTAGVVSVSLSLSGSSFNDTEKEILSSEVKLKETELSQALLESDLEKENLISARTQAAKATEAALRDRERYRILADETALLYERGERTILEKTEADLQLAEAENTLFSRYAAEISAASAYLGLYPESGIDPVTLLGS